MTRRDDLVRQDRRDLCQMSAEAGRKETVQYRIHCYQSRRTRLDVSSGLYDVASQMQELARLRGAVVSHISDKD